MQKPAVESIAMTGPASLKGRGTAWAVPHRFSRELHETVDDGWGTLEQSAAEEQLPPATRVIEEKAKAILSGNDSPDIPFDLSINPYRGCEHGCVYCFARPTHSYLNLSPGLDFETRIIAKVNAAERLREALSARSYTPLLLNIGSATDAYQPAERTLRITRSIIELLAECQHPFSIVTKSSGVERDLDLIAPMAAANLAAVYVSVTSLDAGLSRILEPRAASPARRLQTIATLAKAGVPVGVQRGVALAVGSEPAVPAVAGNALPPARGARDGARARDARRQGLRRAFRQPHERRRCLGAAAVAAFSQGRRAPGVEPESG